MRTQKSGFAEALYPVRFAYNVSQMMLCSYMAIEAFTVAYREVTFQDTIRWWRRQRGHRRAGFEGAAGRGWW